MHALGDVPDLIQRIEATERVSRHHENFWRFGRVGCQYQVHGAGNIGFDAHGFDLGVLGGGTGQLEQRLAGINGKILDAASGLHKCPDEHPVFHAVA